MGRLNQAGTTNLQARPLGKDQELVSITHRLPGTVLGISCWTRPRKGWGEDDENWSSNFKSGLCLVRRSWTTYNEKISEQTKCQIITHKMGILWNTHMWQNLCVCTWLRWKMEVYREHQLKRPSEFRLLIYKVPPWCRPKTQWTVWVRWKAHSQECTLMQSSVIRAGAFQPWQEAVVNGELRRGWRVLV